MTFNPDIHHRRSIRWREYDYSSVGAYFVTVCTQERACLFGDIANREIRLNDAGRMVAEWWLKLPERFPFVTLDEYVVMPNHFHGIIVLHDVGRRGDTLCSPAADQIQVQIQNQNKHKPNLGEHNVAPLQIQNHDEFQRQNQGDCEVRPRGTLEKSLGRIMQALKSLTSVDYVRGVKENGWSPFPGRVWQRNYYERVIRDDTELNRIREYIQCNPANWANDDEYAEV